MVKRSIVSDENLKSGAQSIADDLRVGDNRRLKLAKVIDSHLEWFERARDRGLEWTDIVDILFQAGVVRPDGRPLSRGHLSSLVWRKQKLAAAQQPANQRPSGRKRERVSDPLQSSADRQQLNPTIRDADGSDQNPPNKTLTTNAEDSEDRARLVAFMRRAARMRQTE